MFGDFEGVIPDTANEKPVKTIRELYDRHLGDAAGEYSGRFSVPVLWDKKTHAIVNNESADITVMLNSAFNEFAKAPGKERKQQGLEGRKD